MKIVLVSWTLLLFGASFNSGHYIHQPEEHFGAYSVRDKSSGVTFVNPKPKGRALREILYYHVIEQEPVETPEHTITERSFTNSHGYQFLENHPSSDEQEQYEEAHDENLRNEDEDGNENKEHDGDENENEEHDGDENDEHDGGENEEHDGDENEHDETGDELNNEEETEKQDEEEPESSTTQKPLTDADVKDAYKARSYLFDQMRQRYAVKRMADSLHRRKRQAEMEELKPLPEAPKLSDIAGPNTYGMNINHQGGYVWNNLNKPSYYELGASNGNPSEGHGQENIPIGDNANEEQSNSENSETINENHDSNNEDDLSDICVDINKPCALRLQRSQESYADNSEENYGHSDINYSGANSDESTDDSESNDNSESDDGIPNYPKGSVAFKNPELSSDEPNSNFGDESNKPDAPKTYGMSLTSGGGRVWNELVNPPVSYEVGSSNENPDPINEENYPLGPIIADNGSNNDSGSDDGEPAPIEVGVSENPEAGYPADAVAENPEAMEGILATMQPPEDIPKTYGMNLTSDGGHVWNTLVNPPVSYDIGSSNENPEPVYPYPEPNTSDANNSAEPIVTEEAASNSESNEEDSQTPEFSEIPEPSYNDAAENGPILNANGQPGELSDDNSESNEGASPKEPELYENPTIFDPPVSDSGSSNEHSASNEQAFSIENSEQKESEQENESYGGSQSEEKPASPEESSEGEKPKEPLWNIPEAPTLPPLNYNNLPDYIRDVISSTEAPEYYQPTDSPNPAYSYPHTSSEDQTMEDKTDVPDTYGMSLNGDGGHVWNDMVNPPVSYDVGSPSKSEEEHKEEPTQESNEQPESHESVEVIEEPTYPAEPETQEESKEPGNYEPEPETEPIEEPAEPVVPETEPIEEPAEPEPIPETEPIKEPAEPEPIPETEPIEEPAEPEPVPETEPIEKPAEPVVPGTTEDLENPELNPEPEGEEIHEEEQPEDIEEPSEENHDNLGEQGNEPDEVKPEENAKPDIMNELLKSEQFWRWLGIWTATYMELLEKHIRKIALEEICNHQRIGNQMCPVNDYSEDSGVITKDKIVVDGKEMDLTHRDNLDTELKRGHHNQNNHNKGDGNKIEASTIYGNSVGNEKVTNVFIFTADKADDVIDKLKPANDSDIDYIIDERIKEQNKDKNEAPDDSANKDGSDVDGVSEEISNEEEANNTDLDKEEADKEDSMGSEASNENKEETNKEESILNESDEEGLNKEEDSKQESNENEPNEEEFEKVENSKEESIEGESLEEQQSQESESMEGDKVEASEDASKEGEAEELNKEEENKDGSNEGEENEEDFNKEEENKEASSEVEANEDINKEESTNEKLNNEENNKEGSTEAEVNEEDLNKKEESSEGEANEEETKQDEASEGSNESKEILEPKAEDELNKGIEKEEQK